VEEEMLALALALALAVLVRTCKQTVTQEVKRGHVNSSSSGDGN
jgi:hypothetical protein